jgi:hypothetical protein
MSKINTFSIESSNYLINNCSNFNNKLKSTDYNIINNNSTGYIDLANLAYINAKNSNIYSTGTNDILNLQNTNAYNLPLIYGNIQNKVNTGLYNTTIITDINPDLKNYVCNFNESVDIDAGIVDSTLISSYINNKKLWETKLPVQTGLVDNNNNPIVTAELLTNGVDIFWSKLYQGKFLNNFTITLTETNKSEVLNLLKILPRNLNSYTLTIAGDNAVDINGEFILKNFKNGRIKITKINKILFEAIDCTANIEVNCTTINNILINKIINCKWIKFIGNRSNYTKISSELDAIQNSKLTFISCNIQSIGSNPILSAKYSFISINNTNNLYNKDKVALSKLDTTIFNFVECQATILPKNIKTGLNNTTNNKTLTENHLSNYTNYYINDLIHNANYFNLINHIHVYNSIEQTELVPNGTRILFPQVIKQTPDSNGATSKIKYTSLIPIPTGWSLINTENKLIKDVIPENIDANCLYKYKNKINKLLNINSVNFTQQIISNQGISVAPKTVSLRSKPDII